MARRRKLVRVACAAVACLLPLYAPSADAQKQSRPGVYEGYSQERFDEWVKSSRYVAMRDGVRLAIDLYRPARQGQAVDERFPVVWAHTPYRRSFRNAKGEIVNAAEELHLLPLVKHGYVVAIVDTRGRGASFGARRGFQDRTEAQDAYEMTEWFASQPWSSGAVGIAGCSYLGGTAYHAATTMPPHLRAVAAGCTDFDKYGFVSRGGITAQFNTRPENPEQDFGQGVLPVDADADGSLARAAIAEHLRSTPMAPLWQGMRYRDDVSPLLGVPFWREASVATYAEQIERSGVGLFIWGNWLDEGSFEATLAFNNLRNPRKLWMGSWGHCQVGDFPMATELLRFFDHFLKKVDNGWQREPAIYFRTTNAAPGTEWRSAKRWPLPDARAHTLRLSGAAERGVAGLLTTSKTAHGAGADLFSVDYAPKCARPGDAYFIMWPCAIDNHGLGYATPPLARDAHIAGHPVADLWISASTQDADLFVYLEDVAPNGAATIVTHGRLRASHRDEQPAPYRNFMGLPYHSGERAAAQPLVPGEPVRMRLDLLPTSMIIKAGHRLRLTIAGADPRQRSRNVEFDPPPTIRIMRDAAHPSQLDLPLVGPLEFADAAPVLPKVRGPVPVTNASEPYAAASASEAAGSPNLAELRYVEEEYFVEGSANAYEYDENFNVQVSRTGIPYVTRLLLRRPADLERFSGVVHLENAHPVGGGHSGWSATGPYMIRRGDAYVLLHSGEDALTRGGPIAPERAALRAQLGSEPPLGAMSVLQKFDAHRYAAIAWPNDDAPRWDALIHTAAWLKSDAVTNPLRERVRRVYAQGWSFTGSLLRTFINEGFHDRARSASGAPLVDGYLIGISSSTFVSGVVPLTTGGPILPNDHERRVTAALDVPIIELMSENEAMTNTGPQARENDGGVGRHRLYEVPGLSHGEGLRPQGTVSPAERQLTRRGLPVRERKDECALERSDVPLDLLARAALSNLDAWVERGEAPPRAERLQLDDDGAVVRDRFGNARGGVRVPELEVPLARYAPPSADAPAACRDQTGPFINIRREPLEPATLTLEYGDRTGYERRFGAQLARAVAERWLLAEDAAQLRAEAQRRAREAWGSE